MNQSPASRNHASFHPALLPPSMRENGTHSKHWPPGHKSIPKGYVSFSCSQILRNQAASLTRSQAENCWRLAAIPVPTHASSGPVGASGIQMKQSHSDVTVLPCIPGGGKNKKKKAAKERSCEWFEIMQNVSAEPRLYYLETREEERQRTDGTTVQKKGEEK